MQITTIHVDFKKTVSDGSYGNETHSVGYTVSVAEGDDTAALTADLGQTAREHVYARLKESQNEGIRYAMETPEEREARYQREREEREAERQRRLAASALPATVSSGDPDDDDAEDDDEGGEVDPF
jgi:hypothetical protein